MSIPLLQAQLAGLLALCYMAAAYIGLPLLLGWAFFRSKHVPRALKLAVGSLLGLGASLVCVIGGVLYYARQQADSSPLGAPPQPMHLTLRQPGLLPYPLGNAQLEQARDDSVCLLGLSGTLPRGEQLRVLFLASAHARPHITNLVKIRVDGQPVLQAVGHATYQCATKMITGQFSYVLPNG